MEEYPESFDIGDRLPCVASEIISRGGSTRKTPLKNCSSSGGLALFEAEDDHGEPFYTGFCFSCNQNFYKEELPGTSAGDHVGLDGEGCVTERKTFTKPPKQPPMKASEVKAFMATKTYTTGHYRGIMDKYSKFFGHVADVDSNGKVMARYYPETVEGKVRGFKCRNHPKDFRYGKVGLTGVKCELSGQIKFNSGGKYLLIVGGEEDKAAAYQMLAESQKTRENYKGQEKFSPIPVVSPTAGEGSAAKQVARQQDWCNTYDIIIIGMDNDEAGRNAAKAVAEMLPKEKVRIATWTGKDPNKMLQLGMSGQFVRDFYGAKDYVASAVKTSHNLMPSVREELLRPRITLPSYMRKLQENMGGGPKQGRIINIIGDTSVGKTTHINGLVYHLIFNAPEKPGIISLEATDGQYAIDLMSIHLEKNLERMGDGVATLEYLESPEVMEVCQDLWVDEYGEERFTILDDREGTIGALEGQMELMASKYGCKIFVIDVLTDIIRSSSLAEQDEHMAWQKRFVKKGFTIFNVLHTRKPSPDKDGKVRKINEYDALGSSTIVQSGAINILIHRDKMATDEVEKNTTGVEMPKCRGGVTGPAGEWYFDPSTRVVYDKEDYFSQ
jgi:archaellum biogenesis ATPase FlaH